MSHLYEALKSTAFVTVHSSYMFIDESDDDKLSNYTGRVKGTKTIQRKIDDESVITNGNYNFQLRPNINYTVNDRMNLVIYYDRVVNKPTVSNSFPRYSTSFGARLRLSLNQ